MRLCSSSFAILLIAGGGALSNCAFADWVSTLDTVAGANKVSYWNLQESSGTTAADAWVGFDNINNGAIVGTGVTVGAAGPRPVDGFLGFSSSNNAINFAGSTSQLIQMASASYVGQTELTLLMFYQIPTGTTGNDRILGGIHATDNLSSRYAFLLDSRSTALRGGVRVLDDEAGPTTEIGGLFDAAGSQGRDSTWHFVALTMEDQGANKFVSVYFDGVLVDDGTIVNGAGDGLPARQTSNATGALAFGNDLGDTSRFLVGSLDEIAFIGRSLTAGEVDTLWQSALVPEPASSSLVLSAFVAGLFGLRKRRAKRALSTIE